jgi:D-alanine--poly(phosphoribitol) ligase subunit 2
MLKKKLIDFISERTGVAELDAETPLFSEGLMDSMSVLDLTTFVEQQTGVLFPAADVTLENVDSINRILTYVSKNRTE